MGPRTAAVLIALLACAAAVGSVQVQAQPNRPAPPPRTVVPPAAAAAAAAQPGHKPPAPAAAGSRGRAAIVVDAPVPAAAAAVRHEADNPDTWDSAIADIVDDEKPSGVGVAGGQAPSDWRHPMQAFPQGDARLAMAQQAPQRPGAAAPQQRPGVAPQQAPQRPAVAPQQAPQRPGAAAPQQLQRPGVAPQRAGAAASQQLQAPQRPAVAPPQRAGAAAPQQLQAAQQRTGPAQHPVRAAAAHGRMEQAAVRATAAEAQREQEYSAKTQATCPSWPPKSKGQGVTTATRAHSLVHPLSELTADEYNAVLSYLYDRPKLELEDIISNDPGRNITVANYIHSIHMEMPPKAEVLEWLDSKGPKPARRARCTLVLGKAKPPSTREVLVTITDDGDAISVTDMEKANVMSSRLESVPYPMRPQGPLDENGANLAIEAVAGDLNKFLSQAFDGFTFGDDCGDKCIDWSLTFSQVLKGDVRGSYLQFYWYTSATGDGNYLHAIPLQMLVVASGKRLQSWSIAKVWFAGHFFSSFGDLVHAWKHDKGGMRSKFTYAFPESDEGRYDAFRKRAEPLRGEDQPVGPIAWEPYGRRFKITKGNRISWLGWSLFVGYLPNHGPRFHDLRFKGQRIAYELSMQEAMAVYGAEDLAQANTIFLDSSFGMGYNAREMHQGIDCPMHAAFMDATIFYSGMSGPTTYKNVICVFEHNPETPALRHYSSAYKFYGAVPGAQLVVRMVSTVFNYDYICDLILGVDGLIDVRVTTSGYIMATTWQHGYRSKFGYPMMHNISGTVHTHVLAWKADLDIAGTANSINMHRFEPTITDNGHGEQVYMNKYVAKLLEKEEDSGFIANLHEPRMPIVINEHEKNKWGSPRGYKVQLNRPLANLEPAGYKRSAGLGFWKWNFVVTAHNDAETHSSSMYNQADLANPVTSLPHYVDGDSIRNTDLVVWVNAGLYHVPMAEDAPVTPSTGGNTLGFSLSPYNFFDENPATDMADMVMIDATAIELENATVPYVQRVLRKCKPVYTRLPFSNTGFEGVSHTDDAVARAAANAADTTPAADGGGEDGGGEDGGDEAYAAGGGYDDEGLPGDITPAGSAAAAGAADKQATRNCRKRGRWVSC